MTQTALMDRIRATSSAITSQVSGELVAWHVKASQKVGRWETLATVRDHAGIVEITSDQPGTIKALMFPTGAQVEAGAAIAYFQPDASQTRQNGHHAAIPAPAPIVSAPTAQPSHDPSSAFQAPMPRRRGTLPAAVDLAPVEELVIAPEPAPLARATRKSQKRTINRTYSIGAHQVEAIAHLVLELKLSGEARGINESMLVRTAIAMLCELPRPALLRMIEHEEQREKQERWGRGRPRPGA